MNPVNEQRLELLKTWYAIFVTTMDETQSDAFKMALLRKLREKMKEYGAP